MVQDLVLPEVDKAADLQVVLLAHGVQDHTGLQDGPVLPELSHHGTAGGQWSLLHWVLQGHHPVCHLHHVSPLCPRASSWPATAWGTAVSPILSTRKELIDLFPTMAKVDVGTALNQASQE